MALAVFIIAIRTKKKRKEASGTFVCEHCSEQDCICHEVDRRKNGRK